MLANGTRSNQLTIAPQVSDDVFERAARRTQRSVVHAEPVQAAPTVPVYKDLDEAPDWPQDRIVREVGRLYDARNKLLARPDHPQLIQQGFNNILSELFGLDGKERFKTWPERMAVSAATLPRDAWTGAEPMGQTGDRFSGHAIERAQEVAGLSGGAPLMVKPGSATLGSGAVRAGAKEVKAEPFYSAVEAAVRDAPEGKMTPEQWGGYLRNRPGVKAEELDWIGLPEGQKISKQEMLNHAKEHGVQIKEVKKGGGDFSDYSVHDDELLTRAEEQSMDELPRMRGENDDAWTDRISSRAHEIYGEMRAEAGVDTKFSEYQLPGGNNYREVLFMLPDKAPSNFKIFQGSDGNWRTEGAGEFDRFGYKSREKALEAANKQNDLPVQRYISSHWKDEPNVLAHARMNDRFIPYFEGPSTNVVPGRMERSGLNEMALHPDTTQTGLKTLHLEEIQSDWHQAGRKQGYASKEDPSKWTAELIGGGSRWKILDAQGREIRRVDASGMSAEEAVNIAQNDPAGNAKPKGVLDAPFKTSWPDLVLKRMIREAAENGYDAVSWTPGKAQAARYDLSKHVDEIRWYNDKDLGYRVVGKKGPGVVFQKDSIAPKDLAANVGKELAEKILASEDQHGIMKGIDLKVGGEGMKGFYDDILVRKANALGKKYGAKVEWKELPHDYQVHQNKNEYVVDSIDHPVPEKGFKTQAEAEAWIKERSPKIPVFRLTPELRDVAMRKGFPLFSAGAPYPLIPVDHDPFKEQK